jgi:vancomycin permeability regulator SanA
MIVVLGNTNDDEGNLSVIAINRCDKAIELWRQDTTKHIITTGAFGAHFNNTTISHSAYLKQYLIDKGVTLDRILPNIVSATTSQDIFGLRKKLLEMKVQSLTIVTSDFHYGRVKFYCDLILHDIKELLHGKKHFEIAAAISTVTKEEKAALIAYEQKRMGEIVADFPKDVYNNATAEHKHYDTVSNWMITGQFTTFALGYKFIKDAFKPGIVAGDWEKLLCVIAVFLAVTLFWLLYNRSSQTARAARKTMRTIETCYTQFGFSLMYSTGTLKDQYFTFKTILRCLYLLICVLLLDELNTNFAVVLAAAAIMYLIISYIRHQQKTSKTNK